MLSSVVRVKVPPTRTSPARSRAHHARRPPGRDPQLNAGLDGYVLKDSDPEDVLAAIHSAAHGALVLGRGASDAVVAAAASAPRTDALAALDARDVEILGLLAQGPPT